MVAFTSKIAHLQTTLNMLPEAKLAEALECVSKVPQPEALEDPTYDAHVASLEPVVNGFYSCLLAQDITDVVEDGFCGPGTADGNQVSLVCAEGLCCGEGIAKGAGPETAVHAC